jgi:hypothetical protein
MCTVLLPPGVNPIAVKYIYIYIINNLCESQPEDGFMKKAETCRCYDFFNLLSFNCISITKTVKLYIYIYIYIYSINYWKHNRHASPENLTG